MTGQKQALVFVSFGVSDALARAASLDASAALLAQEFPAWSVQQAYTSNFIRKRLVSQGIEAYSLPELLAKLSADGFARVLIQPSHLTPGEEFDNKVIAAAAEAGPLFDEVLVGRPMFDEVADYERVLTVVLPELKLQSGEELVLLGHGSPHQHNPVYERLQQIADNNQLPVHVGVLEPSDTPNLAMVIDRLRQKGTKQLLLAPLLLAGGSHVTRDMAGSQPDSWLCQLEAAGFGVRTDLRGLGEHPAFRALYVQKVQQTLAKANG
ncbi:sirohydrochlorin cobaltochelatase [Selenomonas sp. GACV-9]|uniref:sirohydrochlorin cobaltochelatase n=1 Tax=Selenomonas sp. GACV-9 TaxID=3158782 RepID=UPI0008F1FA6C|nr:sirohydrochlorin cobaltochelatase [Selenomonas ruminantium]